MAGKDGSTWKHGYIPTNAAATALKSHKKPGGKSKTAAATAKRKPSGPPKLRTKPAARAMPASEREGLRGAAPKQRTKARKVKTQAQKDRDSLSASLARFSTKKRSK